MADIRYSPAIIDDFERADELYPPGILPPWYWTPGWDRPVSLESGSIGSPSVDPNFQAQSSWMGAEMEGDCEAWGIAGGDAPLHDGYYFGLHTAEGNGYYIRNANSVGGGDTWEIWKRGVGRLTTGLMAHNITGYAPDYCLIQLSGSTISGYLSTDAGANWTLMVQTTDNDYRDDLYMSFGGQGGGPGWVAIGGGPIIRRRSQIFRYVAHPDGIPAGVVL